MFGMQTLKAIGGPPNHHSPVQMHARDSKVPPGHSHRVVRSRVGLGHFVCLAKV